MAQTTTPTSALNGTLDRLARIEPAPAPVLSLYLNLQADQHGKDHHLPFVKKELLSRARTYPPQSDARASYDRDVQRIERYLANEVPPSANGLALFACSAVDLFEAVVLNAPITQHRLSVSNEPHLYPLELLLAQHPAHAVVLVDSHLARVFVFALGGTIAEQTVPGERIKHTRVGGWSQMRYQRHVEELRAEHARELVRTLEQIVRSEGIQFVVLAGDDVNVALVRNELPEDVAPKVIDVVKLEKRTPEQDVMRAAAEALRRHDARSDAEAVDQLLGDYRAGGLAVVGVEATSQALELGQVDELYLTTVAPAAPDRESRDAIADDLVAKARQTSALVRFIEDPALLEPVGGVAAALRYRLDGRPLGKGRTYEQTDQRQS
jgi:peptide chain release factor subunit 1